MAETIKVACPGCDAIFAIPVDLGGEIGECTECDTVFVIPALNQKKKRTEVKPIIPKMSEEEVQATGTIKLSRASIGMIPDLKDAFNFGVTDDKSAVHSSMNDIFDAPSALPKQPTAANSSTLHLEEEENPRHGGLKLANTSAPETQNQHHNSHNSSQAIDDTKNRHSNHPTSNMESTILEKEGISEKDKIVSLLLCICLGMLGVHRFYVGKTITGVLMLITAGGLGIWWWIDIIMIVSDNFKDAKGLAMQ